jgi:hypothetical protein
VKLLLFLLLNIFSPIVFAQVKWVNVDSLFLPLPASLHIFKTTDSLNSKPFIAYYADAILNDKNINFTVDTALNRRLTPNQFFQRNENPLLVVNGTFFSYATNRNLNLVMRKGKLLSYNVHSLPMHGKATMKYVHPLASAIGIDKKRDADVAWLFADSGMRKPYAVQFPERALKDSFPGFNFADAKKLASTSKHELAKWKMKTAIGGGPVLVQNGAIKITNEEELKFTGRGISDKHPRTCMGYTANGHLIIMVIQGRFPGIAEGATLIEEANLMNGLGCKEALNLDGGGSSCMLINGKQTITPSDKDGQRATPAVFEITLKKD